MNEVFAFTLISLLLVISPGPNSVLIVKTVTRKGRRAGIENIIGLVSATFIHGAISILGLSAIILQSAELFVLIKYLGAAYLLYLGIKTILGSFGQASKNQPLDHAQEPQASSGYQHIVEGLLTQILNPKVSMFYLAAFPQFVDFEAANYWGAFLLVAIHATIIFFWFLGVSVFISRIKQLAGESALSRWVQRCSGSLLIYFSALLVTQDSKP